MTRDDLNKLISGYAAGSLSEAEKQLLFEAALDDQELFDQLAHEQSWKEILDQPGARQRLIAALADPEPRVAWWRRPLVWSIGGAVAVAVIAVSWIDDRRPQPVEMARVESAASPAERAPEQPKAAAPAPPPAAAPQIKSRPAALPLEDAKQKSAAPAAAANEPKPRQEARDAISKKDSEETARALDKTAVAAAPPPPPVASARSEPARQQPATQATQSAEQSRAQVLAQTQALPLAGQHNQAQGALAPANSLRAKDAPPFGLEYSFEDTELVLKFDADGYFSMHFSPGEDTIVESRVIAGTTRREKVPNNATEAAIVFTAAPQTTSGGLSVVRQDKTGTVEDPSRRRIELLLQFYP